jgi:hypothetical protein
MVIKGREEQGKEEGAKKRSEELAQWSKIFFCEVQGKKTRNHGPLTTDHSLGTQNLF